MIKDLSQAQCILLAVHYAASADVKSLHSFTPNRPDVFDPELVLRILLTYLPECLDPRQYVTYISEVASRLYLDTTREELNIVSLPPQLADLSASQAAKRVRKLDLLDLRSPSFPPYGPDDILTKFICHRSYRIDVETGLLDLIPVLVEPFLSRNEFIRTWYASVALPMVRLYVQYHDAEEDLEHSTSVYLRDFETYDADRAIDVLMQRAWEKESAEASNTSRQSNDSLIARDVKSVVGPWMYGHTDRKRRMLAQEQSKKASHSAQEAHQALPLGSRKVGLADVTASDKTDHGWEDLFRWLVVRSQQSFPAIAGCIEEWNGPSDIDLGLVLSNVPITYLDQDLQRKLELQYCQAVFATCYAAVEDTQATIKCAHLILARLAELLDFVPPPDLATSVDSLPKIERHATKLDESQTVTHLEPDSLLQPEHPLTTPRLETYMLLQMILYSAYQFSNLGHAIALVSVAKLHFYASQQEQTDTFRQIMRTLSEPSTKRDQAQWTAERAKLIWLWGWGVTESDQGNEGGAGVLGKVPRVALERELLECFIGANLYELAVSTYLPEQAVSPLSRGDVEDAVLEQAMEAYDGASNGNRTRGSMKKAYEIVSAFGPHFPSSKRFTEAKALIAATHALSFYSLTLQHGVPFKPVNIRVSQDPVGLIEKVMEQNARSYAKLDDLISIGQNIVMAGLQPLIDDGESDENPDANAFLENQQRDVTRRVTFMAIEAALREDDFETAYSYTINRLTPTSSEINAPDRASSAAKHTRVASRATVQRDLQKGDDTSWRAAFLAGRFRPASSSPPTLRRLEQRTELLSLALLLAPTPALTEVLAAWRRCEEEASALHRAQQEAEQEFDDAADRRVQSALPGNFVIDGEQPAMILNQKRREVGRAGTARRENDDAPLSMFDLTRSAARAISQSAFPLRPGGAANKVVDVQKTRDSTESERDPSSAQAGVGGDAGAQNRVRRRDMVASAVSGGLASGIGWVLGAAPANAERHGQS